MTDPNCICIGNWRAIVKETLPFLDRHYLDHKGKEFVFFGLVHGSDDYYYGMYSLDTNKTQLLSCVGSIEGHGFTLVGDKDD